MTYSIHMLFNAMRSSVYFFIVSQKTKNTKYVRTIRHQFRQYLASLFFHIYFPFGIITKNFRISQELTFLYFCCCLSKNSPLKYHTNKRTASTAVKKSETGCAPKANPTRTSAAIIFTFITIPIAKIGFISCTVI